MDVNKALIKVVVHLCGSRNLSKRIINRKVVIKNPRYTREILYMNRTNNTMTSRFKLSFCGKNFIILPCSISLPTPLRIINIIDKETRMTPPMNGKKPALGNPDRISPYSVDPRQNNNPITIQKTLLATSRYL